MSLDDVIRRILDDPRVLGGARRLATAREAVRGEVKERLRDHDFLRFRLFAAAKRLAPALSFTGWLRLVVERTAHDYLRGRRMR